MHRVGAWRPETRPQLPRLWLCVAHQHRQCSTCAVVGSGVRHCCARRHAGHPPSAQSIDIMGNVKADPLTKEGRVRLWAYSCEWVREVQRSQTLEWHVLGPQELDSEVSDIVERSEGRSLEGQHSCRCGTDCTCRGLSSHRVSELGSAVSVESWESDPRSEPAPPKYCRIDHERESTVHGSAHGVL